MLQMLVYVPNAKPHNPNIRIPMSFQRTQLCFPNPSCQKVIISITGGNIRAKVELLTAPTKDITADKFGIAAAKATETEGKMYIY